ncbi:isochorismatase family protein [Mariniblastus sp.]|nr:isochorismatase family protein [bacterium]MDA7903397.1 isochorismatase family protein [Mariniblastus sp.]MDA7925019.1 isochorismatase family protein [Mariniblastus sp.]MDA7928518.1 isochorismatase family protein [Mariniblastus sp.]MDB4357679.1 isochorismatase family protein [Mariniblastus sp.]
MNSQDDASFSSFRSPLLMNADDTAIIVIDAQEKLMPLIQNQDQIQCNIIKLLRGAKALGVISAATEQYPRGLGATVEPIRNELEPNEFFPIAEKTMFSVRQCEPLLKKLSKSGVQNLLLCGIETHICIAQSALDLMSLGFRTFICADAVGSRNSLDHQLGINRMEGSGAVITTTEAAIFELCMDSKNQAFKTISKLAQQ